MNEIHISNAVDLILNTREFCGNEKESVRDYCAHERIDNWYALWQVANFRANAFWNEYKKDAGVNPKYIY
jgi:hypothetical protein